MIEFTLGNEPVPSHQQPCFIVVAQDHLLSCKGENWQPLSSAEFTALGLQEISRHYLGHLNNQPCYVVECSREQPFTNHEWFGLRSFLGRVDDELFQLLGRALQVVTWHNDHQFCGRCGAETVAHERERAKLCSSCDLQYYPRLSPCVIVIITRGKECLLARNARFPEGYFSALAGFIEPGETVEAALAREVKEEVGIEIKNLRYFASQPWPFPGQLMLGFHAEYAGGEVCVDGDEIVEAHWYHYDQLPLIPPRSTLSGHLIEHFVSSAKHIKE